MIELKIKGLHCADCVGKIEKSMSSLEGIEHIKLNFSTSKMQIRYNPDAISLEEIHSKIKSLGYGILDEEIEEISAFSLKNRKFVFTFISGIAMLLGLVMYFLTPDTVLMTFYLDIHTSSLLFIIAMVFGGYHAVKKAGKALLNKVFVIDSLMLIGALGAVLIDAFAEGAAVLFLFSLADLLEGYSIERSRKSLNELVNITPKVASVRRGEKYIDIPIEEIQVGDMVLVRSGERIAVDGQVIKGVSSINQAPITGESMPVTKDIGDIVFAGTINQEGSLEIQVMKGYKDSTVAKIIELVESAEEQKAPIERFIDQFAKYYTPAVIIMAVMVTVIPTWVFQQPFNVWFYKSLLLLLISCPCALALSTPISIVSGITSGAKNGVLFKGGAYVEQLAKIDTFAFDKTGTLTEGKPVVTDVIPFNGYSREDVLSIASTLECRSEHPLGKAIVEIAEHESFFRECSDFTAITGKGIKGIIENETYLVGSKKLFNPETLSNFEEDILKLEDEAKTIVIVGKENEAAGIIGLSDKIRDGSKRMVEDLHAMGIKQVIMLTGDNKRTAKAVAEKIGVDEYHAELLPEQKVSFIKKAAEENRRIAMVGDGMNDAPALATAHLGIAMGAAGSDTALEVADIALMDDNISRIPYLLSLGKRTMGIVKQNIALAIGIKLLFAILVFPGLVTLWMAVAIGDMGVSLAVIFNALRLTKVR
ncbi:MAG: cadmium-translocating P-type ATPase [Thermoplasmata archaeon]|nr:cadmium-translocating P-type ATPase [Thermoplasmata archaeon]